MDDPVLIPGFGVITVKQAMGEVKYFADLMQTKFREGNITMALQAMRNIRPFVEALKKKGYSIDQILPE